MTEKILDGEYALLSEIASKLKIPKTTLSYYVEVGKLVPEFKVGPKGKKIGIYSLNKSIEILKEIKGNKKSKA